MKTYVMGMSTFDIYSITKFSRIESCLNCKSTNGKETNAGLSFPVMYTASKCQLLQKIECYSFQNITQKTCVIKVMQMIINLRRLITYSSSHVILFYKIIFMSLSSLMLFLCKSVRFRRTAM